MNSYKITTDFDNCCKINAYDENTYTMFSATLNENDIQNNYVQTVENFKKIVLFCIKDNTCTFNYLNNVLQMTLNYDDVITCKFDISLCKVECQSLTLEEIPLRKLNDKVSNINYHTDSMYSTVCVGMCDNPRHPLIGDYKRTAIKSSKAPYHFQTLLTMVIPNVPINISFNCGEEMHYTNDHKDVTIGVGGATIYPSLKYIKCKTVTLCDHILFHDNIKEFLPTSMEILKLDNQTSFDNFLRDIKIFSEKKLPQLKSLEIFSTKCSDSNQFKKILTTNIKTIKVKNGEITNYSCLDNKIKVEFV